MHLARFPRRFIAHLPTPLERLDRLSAELGGPEIWIKRDDCTGLSTGGNKTRKLEFLMAEAELQGVPYWLSLCQGLMVQLTAGDMKPDPAVSRIEAMVAMGLSGISSQHGGQSS